MIDARGNHLEKGDIVSMGGTLGRVVEEVKRTYGKRVKLTLLSNGRTRYWSGFVIEKVEPEDLL